jgi:polar amino acid transport system substrate-binding protein
MLKLIFCISIMLFSSFSVAEEKIVNLAINIWTPFASPELENNGPLAEVSSTAFSRVGYKTTLEFLPWKRALSDAAEGRYDGLMGAYFNEERAKLFLYSRNIIGKAETGIITNIDSEITFNQLTDLSSYKIGLLRGIEISEEFSQHKSQLNLVTITTEASLIRMLRGGRVDMLAGSKQVIFAKYQNLYPGQVPGENLKMIGNPLDEGLMFMAFSRKMPNGEKVRDDFDRGFKMILDDGTYDRIMKKHGLQ